MIRNALIVLLITMFFQFLGCSGGSATTPVSPDYAVQAAHTGGAGGHILGVWQFAADPAAGTVDIAELRGSDFALNVLGFMEPPALQNLSIDFDTLDIDAENNRISVDVIFTHPFVTPTATFRGFDVRGIVFGPAVANADGFTPILRPKDFSGEPFGYVDGLLGAPDSFANYSADENGYKYFCDGLDADTELWEFFSDEDNIAMRGTFSEGEQNRRHYDLDFAAGESDFFVFNYAVLASYDWPAGDPPYAIEDFSMSTANTAEPFAFSYAVVENNLYYNGSEGGGDITFDIEAWDWQGITSAHECTIDAKAFGGTVPASSILPGNTSASGIFHFDAVPGTPTSTADIEIELTVADTSETYGSFWFLDLLSPGNDLYDTPVYTKWYFTVPVGPGSQMKEIIPVAGQTNLGIVVSTYPYKPPADIAVNSFDGKPKVMYTQDTASGGHNVYRFLPDYAAHDGNLVNYSHVWAARGFDTTNGWTVTGHPYQPVDYPDFGGAVNMWGNMNEAGSYPIGVYWASAYPFMEIMDAFETDDPSHEDWLWAVFDATVDGGGMRFYYHDTHEAQPGTAHAACFCFAQLNQPDDQGIFGADVRGIEALRNQFMFVFLEGDSVELWYIASSSTLGYGGITITGFEDALDVSVDSEDYIWVLDQPGGEPRLQAFDPADGSLVAVSGDITSSINGTPLRIDLDESDDQCHLLHTAGVSVFMIDW